MGGYPPWTDAQEAVLYWETQRLIKENGGKLPTASSPLWKTLPDKARLRTDHASTEQYPVHYKWMMWCFKLGLSTRSTSREKNAERLVRRELAGAPRYTREGWPDGTPTAKHLSKARSKLRKTDPIFGTDPLDSRLEAARAKVIGSNNDDDGNDGEPVTPRTEREGAESPATVAEEVKRDEPRRSQRKRPPRLAPSIPTPRSSSRRRSSRLEVASAAPSSTSTSRSASPASRPRPGRDHAPEPEKPLARTAPRHSSVAPRTTHPFDLVVSNTPKKRNAVKVADSIREKKARVAAGA